MAEKKIQSVRGMNDLLPPDSAKRLAFENACRRHFMRFGYSEIRTPIVESTDLFSRGIGEGTDVVEKEMYTFADRKGRSLTMRPEMTASCVRSYIQHGIAKKEPVTRWFYIGPMFRYERVQTGRYRQFHQVGAEAFGVAEATVEAEQIAMLSAIYSDVGIGELDVVINSVGTREDRVQYREALLEYFEPRVDELCGNCQRRVKTNPFRLLDCKADSGSEIVISAPSVLEFLSPASVAHFEGVKQTLTDLGVSFRVDAKMVRGLDYYTSTVFEIISGSNALGSQSTVVGGGRYDELVESLGGPSTPAAGFALGIERNVMCMPGEATEFVSHPDVFVVAWTPETRRRGQALAGELRDRGIAVEIEHRPISAKAQFKRADKLGARFVATLGEDEHAAGTVNLRNMSTRNEAAVAQSALADAIKKQIS